MALSDHIILDTFVIRPSLPHIPNVSNFLAIPIPLVNFVSHMSIAQDISKK